MSTPALTPERQALYQALATQAAGWWANRLQRHDYASDFDNGDKSEAGELTQILASMAAMKSPRTPESKVEAFRAKLAADVLARLLADPLPAGKKDYAHRDLVLGTDYAPEGLLREVADAIGVRGFPWKTTMWVNWDARPEHCHVEVRAGYGRETQRLPVPTVAA